MTTSTASDTVVSGMIEYRIDDLAREAGTTVRNVRAYQDRGLLPAPRRQGRVGWYSEAHLARLRLIGQMLERGYTLANIRELVGAWETGQDVGDLLGLEAALSAPWSDDTPAVVATADLGRYFGDGPIEAEAVAAGVEQAVAAGILEPVDGGYLVRRPRLLQIAAELVAAGIPIEAVLELGRTLTEQIDGIARSFVDLATRHVFDPVGEPIPAEEVPRLAEVVRRLRPLAQA